VELDRVLVVVVVVVVGGGGWCSLALCAVTLHCNMDKRIHRELIR